MKKPINIIELLQQAYKVLEVPIGRKPRTIEDLLEEMPVKTHIKKIQACLKTNQNIELCDSKMLLILIILFRKEESSLADLDNITLYLGLHSQLNLLSLSTSIDQLINLGLVVSDYQGRSELRRAKKIFYDHFLDTDFLQSLIENNPSKHKTVVYNTDTQFIRKVWTMYYKMNLEANEHVYRFCLRNLIRLIKFQSHLDIVKKLTEIFGEAKFGDENEKNITPSVNFLACTVILFNYINNQEDEINPMHLFEDAFGMDLSLLLLEDIENKTHPLVDMGFVEISPANFQQKLALLITIKPKIMSLVPSMPLDSLFNNVKFLSIEPPAQNSIKLYFPNEVKSELDLVEKIVQSNGFDDRLTVFLHGGPGTGKTSWVQQLSYSTKKIVISPKSIKTKWYGESQSNLTKLWDEIDSIIGKLENAPIIFIDEADALIGKRQLNEPNSETDNELQTILLRRIEKYHGILIMASNFPISSFDEAFERRMDVIIEVKSSSDTLEQMLTAKLQDHQIPFTKDQILPLINSNKLSPAIIDLCLKRAKLHKLTGASDFNVLQEISKRIGNTSSSIQKIGFAKAS